MDNKINNYTGMMATALRWVVGWTYFSAFWRRLILENKLDPEGAGYIGEKFNHFLPHALGIKPMIEYLVTHPDVLWWAMAVFTIVEAAVGLLIMLGLFTRLASVGVFFLALGILLGSGWIGTTCLDEWQIGILGVAAGFMIFFTGGGKYSLDQFFIYKGLAWTKSRWFAWMASGTLPMRELSLNRMVLTGSVLIFSLTLFTNQVFHGGVFGKLHNKSVRPHIVISDAQMAGNMLIFKIFRDEGADVYGSFLIGVELIDGNEKIIFSRDQQQLSSMSEKQI